MKWKEKQYKTDDVRRRQGFLFLPKRVHDDVRWLEQATWDERYYGAGWHISKWIDQRE